MKYISVSEAAKKWGISERSVRNYCAGGRVSGVRLVGKTWEIPDISEKPERATRSDKKRTLLDVLREEKSAHLSGGIYHRVQIDLTYNSNHIEGSRLTHDETRYIFETNTIGLSQRAVNVDDIIETSNHFRCIDLMIENAHLLLSEKYIKELHFLLKSGTSDSRREWFRVGEYKKLANEVGGIDTTEPKLVAKEMKALLDGYNAKPDKNLEDIIAFHVAFERIHPFQDGNGRVGRLIMFGECLKHNITPFIIDEEHKLFYYRGLKEWDSERGYIIDTCLSAQDKFSKILSKFIMQNS